MTSNNDPRRVPAMAANAFAVAAQGNKMVRIVFGETLGKPEDANFHIAVQIDREGAGLLIKFLQQALEPPKSGRGSASGGGEGFSVITGSTTRH